MSEEDEWSRAVAGDADAFADVFDRHHARVYRHAVRLSGSRSDAEDVTAMVFFEAWRRRQRVRVVDGSVIVWLLVTATNVARNQARSRRRHAALLARVRPESAHPDHAEGVLATEAAESDRMIVQGAFARLSPADQQVLALCVIEELPPAEVALLLRLPAGTVRTRLSRAKVRLRELLGTTWEGNPA